MVSRYLTASHVPLDRLVVGFVIRSGDDCAVDR
jgi:hypothetical protein